MRGFWVFVFCVCASAQVFFLGAREPLPAADLIVTGTLLGANATTVNYRTTIVGYVAVGRVIQGDARAGDRIPVRWEFLSDPMHGPSTKPPEGPSLWFLAGRSGFREPTMPGMFRRYFSVPIAGPLPEPFIYKPEAPLDEKLAAEMAFAMEQAAAAAGTRLNVQRIRQGNSTVVQSNETAYEFGKLLDIWTRLAPEYLSPYSERFAASPAPAMRAIAVGDMLARDDSRGIAMLQREAAVLSAATTADEISAGVRRMPPLAPLETLHAIGRIAVGEADLGMEVTLASILGQDRRVELLPYLVAMLESPQENVQMTAGLGICWMLGPQWAGGATAYWTSVMSDNCRIPQFWKQWWNGPRKEIPELAALPEIPIPARYKR